MLIIMRVLILNAAFSFRHASRATFLPEEGYKESASIGAHPAFLLREDQGPPLPRYYKPLTSPKNSKFAKFQKIFGKIEEKPPIFPYK